MVVALIGCQSTTSPAVQSETTEDDSGEIDTADTGTADTGGETGGDTGADTDSAEVTGCTGEGRNLEIEGSITEDTSWCRLDNIRLHGWVSVTSGVTLTVEAGTTVQGMDAEGGERAATLHVSAGARIVADGTAEAPITLTHHTDADAPVYWGGLRIEGNAPGATNPLGDPDDDSGVLRYVRILHVHDESRDYTVDSVILENVGAGTTVEYVEVRDAAGDGFELHGGTVALRRVVVLDVGDEAIQWTDGWSGELFEVYAGRIGSDGLQGANRDPAAADIDDEPLSSPLIANVTLAGVDGSGLQLEDGTAGEATNILLTGVDCGLEADETALTLVSHTYIDGENAYCDAESEQLLPGAIAELDPQLSGHMPAAGSPALDPGNADARYATWVGAFGTEDWSVGWTTGL